MRDGVGTEIKRGDWVAWPKFWGGFNLAQVSDPCPWSRHGWDEIKVALVGSREDIRMAPRKVVVVPSPVVIS